MLSPPPPPRLLTSSHIRSECINTPATTSLTRHHLQNTRYITPSTSHQLQYIFNTTSTEHHIHCIMNAKSQHDLINPSPSTQHHLHNATATSSNAIYSTSSDTGTLGALVLDCSFFCFADVFDSWSSLDIANMWGCPIL